MELIRRLWVERRDGLQLRLAAPRAEWLRATRPPLKTTAVLLAIGLAASCGVSSSHTTGVEALFVAPHAENTVHGNNTVTFRIHEPHPAQAFVRSIQEHFTSRGWVERDGLIMNPGQKSSDYENRWAEHLEGNDRVHTWAANWESPKGEFVVCYLRYRTPEDQSVSRSAFGEVMQVYLSAAQVDRMRRGRDAEQPP